MADKHLILRSGSLTLPLRSTPRLIPPPAPPPSFDEVPYIEPGAGWIGETAQPDPVGDSEVVGGEDKPTCRWDTVLYQDIDGDFYVGVTGDHIAVAGMDYVLFAVNGGEWLGTDTPTYNPNTGMLTVTDAEATGTTNLHSDTGGFTAEMVPEDAGANRKIVHITGGTLTPGTYTIAAFVDANNLTLSSTPGTGSGSTALVDPVLSFCAKLNSEDFDANATIQVRAIAYPVNGVPRVLGGVWSPTYLYQSPNWTGEHALILYANYAQQVVELAAGEYQFQTTPFTGGQSDANRWKIFRPASGVAKEDILLNGVNVAGSNSFVRLKIQGITIANPASNTGIFRGMTAATDLIWIDDCEWTGNGQYTGQVPDSLDFVTNCTWSDSQFGPHAGFVRNTTITRIGEDVIRGGYFIVNTTIHDNERGPNDWHPSTIANPMNHDNRIYDNLSITECNDALAFRSGTNVHWEQTDILIRNTYLRKIVPEEGNILFPLGGQCSNFFVKNASILGNHNYRNGVVGQPLQNFTPIGYVVYEDVTFQEGNTPDVGPWGGMVIIR